MSDSRSDPQMPPDAAAFDRIEAALAESERGRRFLAEFARRHRAADTDTLLQAIARLEGVVTQNTGRHGPDESGSGEGLASMAEAIARARAEIAAMGEDRDRPAPAAAFEAIVPAAERAGADILAAAEAVQETAWTLRETGAEAAACDGLDRRAAEIHAACAAQDLTMRRTGRALCALRDLERGIAAMIAGRPPAGEPAPLPSLGDDLAFVPVQAALEPRPIALQSGAAPNLCFAALSDDEPASTSSESALDIPPAGPQPRAEGHDTEDLAAAFADLDRLSIEEKIALFS